MQHKSNGYAYGAVPGVSLVAEMDSIRLGWKGGMAWYLSLAVGGGGGGGGGGKEGGRGRTGMPTSFIQYTTVENSTRTVRCSACPG